MPPISHDLQPSTPACPRRQYLACRNIKWRRLAGGIRKTFLPPNGSKFPRHVCAVAGLAHRQNAVKHIYAARHHPPIALAFPARRGKKLMQPLSNIILSAQQC
jgi:hypothetical protein